MHEDWNTSGGGAETTSTHLSKQTVYLLTDSCEIPVSSVVIDNCRQHAETVGETWMIVSPSCELMYSPPIDYSMSTSIRASLGENSQTTQAITRTGESKMSDHL